VAFDMSGSRIDVGQHERVQHGVEGVEHPAHSRRQQRAALLGGGLSQELDEADWHGGRDCSRGAMVIVRRAHLVVNNRRSGFVILGVSLLEIDKRVGRALCNAFQTS
jgi:hypothetical protein